MTETVQKRSGDMAQVVECLPSKWDTLSSNSGTKNKNKNPNVIRGARDVV
jgi:hypothetical protein